MIYVLYGTESFLINRHIDKIIADSEIDNLNITRYDLENTSIEDILKDSNSMSLFSDKKIIVVSNAYIFTGTTNKKLMEQNVELLEKYIKNPSSDTIIIFSIVKDKLDERKKIVKLCKEKGYLKDFNNVSNINSIVVDMFGEYKINTLEINLLVDRVGSNLAILESEINKIKIYKGTDLTITKEDIINLTSKNINTDIFTLIENIVIRNKEKAIDSYREMVKLGEEPIMILIMLSNQFRLIYQVKKLYQKGFSEKDIASKLKVHWYPVRKCMDKMRNYDDKLLIKYIYDLANLDIEIKKGTIEKDLALELFILSI